MDDVIIFGRNFDENIERLDVVLTRFGAAGLKLKPAKCLFFSDRVTFLGHVITREGILPDPDNLAKIANWPVPWNVREVRGIIGLGNYYRRFVKDYSKRVQPLVSLTKKNTPFKWTRECQEAFEDLKRALLGPDIMSFPTDDGLFILDTDASDETIGAVLSQVQLGREKVIAFGSRSLGKSERNYCATDRELLALKYFVQYYKHYLLGRKFVVRSDHESLKWLYSLKEPKHRIARWIEVLSEFDFELEYRPGRKHSNADAMSRCPNPRQCSCNVVVEHDLPCKACKKCLHRAEQMIGTLPRELWKSQNGFQDHQTLIRRLGAPSLKSNMVPCPRSGRGYSTQLEYRSPIIRQAKLAVCRQIHGYNTRSKSKQKQRDTSQDTKVNNRGYPQQQAGRGSSRKSTGGWNLIYNPVVLRRKQLADPDIAPVLKWKESGRRPFGQEVCVSSPATRHYWSSWGLLVIKNGMLMRKFIKRDGTSDSLQLIVPRGLQREVLWNAHDGLLGGHLGQKKTREKALKKFYWRGIREDCNNWVNTCDVCARQKRPQRKPHAPLGSMATGAPLDRLATDILGPFPESTRGNKYVLAVTDYFTKWVEIFPIPDQTAPTCAEIILNEVIARFGCPYNIHSDQGRNYESVIFSELCQLLEIRKTRTSPGHPSCNGQVERFNRTLVSMIKAYLKGQQREWDKHLGCLAAAYRSTPHESTGFTPNMLMFGREARLPIEVILGIGATSTGEEVASYGDYVNSLKERMQVAHDLARKHLGRNALRMKESYDAKKNLNQYNRGDLVWYATESKQLHTAPKLRVPFQGPYLVLDRLGDLLFKIQLDEKGKQKIVHHDKLKPYERLYVPPWVEAALAN